MTRDELLEKLDIDKNGKVRFEDLAALVEGNDKRLFWIGVLCGAVPAGLIGWWIG